jgi:hypothetical protein
MDYIILEVNHASLCISFFVHSNLSSKFHLTPVDVVSVRGWRVAKYLFDPFLKLDSPVSIDVQCTKALIKLVWVARL